MNRFATLLVLPCLALALPGCITRDPELTVDRVALTATSDEASILEFTIRARNRNDVELPTRGVEYSLWLGDERVFTGTRSGEATLPRFGDQLITLPAVVRAEDWTPASGETAYRFWCRVWYTRPGPLAETLYDTWISRPSASVRERGQLALDGNESSD